VTQFHSALSERPREVTATLPFRRAVRAEPTPGVVDVEAVYGEYGNNCYGLALRIVGDRELAHDVVQSVFESLSRQPDRFEPERGTLLTWLMTLTHHKAVDMVRWRRRRTGLDAADDVLVELSDLMPTPEDAAVVSDERARVAAALQRLKLAEREVLVLAYFGGYSQSEIARRIDVPLGTVKGRTVTALRRMRLHLASQ
jgi:RNA polymerase sigma factor (sigma-70 family)